MSVCLEQNNFKNDINNFSQNLSINEKALVLPKTITPQKHFFEKINYWIARSRQRKHLASLDERMLNDIGFTATQARVEYSKPFWK